MPISNRWSPEKREQFIEAYRKSFGIMHVACKMIGLARNTVWEHMRKDPEWPALRAELDEQCLDLVESKLIKKIEDGDTTSIIFYLKTKGRKRGYIESHAVQMGIGSIEEMDEVAKKIFGYEKKERTNE